MCEFRGQVPFNAHASIVQVCLYMKAHIQRAVHSLDYKRQTHVLVKVPARVLSGNYCARGKFEKVM